MIEKMEESNNFVKVQLKKSSSSGKVGYDIDVKSDGSRSQDDLNTMGDMAFNTALRLQGKLEKLEDSK